MPMPNEINATSLSHPYIFKFLTGNHFIFTGCFGTNGIPTSSTNKNVDPP